ncbi:MAG: hypothetical protein LBD93_01560 [Treponema sp.]|nr:hypothetical protein [Treponema sp.]
MPEPSQGNESHSLHKIYQKGGPRSLWEIGAIGIALLTKREIAEKGFTSPHGPRGKTRVIGFDTLERFDYTQESKVTCPCCANNCSRMLVRFSHGTSWVTGNHCERGEILGDPRDPVLREQVKRVSTQMEAVPDLVAAEGLVGLDLRSLVRAVLLHDFFSTGLPLKEPPVFPALGSSWSCLAWVLTNSVTMLCSV